MNRINELSIGRPPMRWMDDIEDVSAVEWAIHLLQRLLEIPLISHGIYLKYIVRKRQCILRYETDIIYEITIPIQTWLAYLCSHIVKLKGTRLCQFLVYPNSKRYSESSDDTKRTHSFLRGPIT